MKRILLLVAIAAAMRADETRREIVNPAPAPAQDARHNSDQVPDAGAI